MILEVTCKITLDKSNIWPYCLVKDFFLDFNNITNKRTMNMLPKIFYNDIDSIIILRYFIITLTLRPDCLDKMCYKVMHKHSQ